MRKPGEMRNAGFVVVCFFAAKKADKATDKVNHKPQKEVEK